MCNLRASFHAFFCLCKRNFQQPWQCTLAGLSSQPQACHSAELSSALCLRSYGRLLLSVQGEERVAHFSKDGGSEDQSDGDSEVQEEEEGEDAEEQQPEIQVSWNLERSYLECKARLESFAAYHAFAIDTSLVRAIVLCQSDTEYRQLHGQVASTPYDFRFPGINQARACYTRYNEFHK